MLINKIINYADSEYRNHKCKDCNYETHCPRDCAQCLHYIHTPSAAPAPRKYDCANMANYYVCKYSHKYMSELIYAFSQLKDLRDKKHLKVMSIGCGPSTELFALDFLKERGEYSFDTIEFRGVDSAKSVWEKIHKKIKKYNEDKYNIKFYYTDIMNPNNRIKEATWIPDLLIFQYVFSDMQKHSTPDELQQFISEIVYLVNNKMNVNTYIVMNDINLSTTMGGGREHFDRLLRECLNVDSRTYHFNNSNRPTHYEYGTHYPSNQLFLGIPESLNDYSPFTSCASAQLIIKKVIE